MPHYGSSVKQVENFDLFIDNLKFNVIIEKIG